MWQTVQNVCPAGCSGKGGLEVLQHNHDVLAVAFQPDGKVLASSTLDGQIYFWDPENATIVVSQAKIIFSCFAR